MGGVTRQGVVLTDLQSPQTSPERPQRAGGAPRSVWPRGGGSKRRDRTRALGGVSWTDFGPAPRLCV